MTRKIYDCFIFSNELDLLELRLEEQHDHIDYFVIAEANLDFQGNNKSFILEENWERYSKYHDKIVYVKVDDMPIESDDKGRERHLRNSLSRGYQSADDNDVIFISDCCELIRPSTFDLVRNDSSERYLWVCRQPIFRSKLNNWQHEPLGYDIGTMAAIKGKIPSPQEVRDLRSWFTANISEIFQDNKKMAVQHAGWNFSLLGIETSESQESFLPVVMDEYFPKTVVENQEKWQNLIIPAAENIKNYLSKYD
jgi:beta-1,4-mannosyl-glycoprotein beta-1,4-N-acetylglucosaminyltransferase